MIAKVIVDINSSEVDKIYDYISIDGVQSGSRVVVPFANRHIDGYVISLEEKSSYPENKLKRIDRIQEDTPVLFEETLKLACFMKDKYHVPMAQILKLFLPSEMRKGTVRQKDVRYFYLNPDKDVNESLFLCRRSGKQQEAIKFLQEKDRVKSSVFNNMFTQVSNVLLERGIILECFERENRTPYKGIKFTDKDLVLTEEQKSALDAIESSNKPVLIHGVTGSGKTEVYLNAISKEIEKGNTAIFLVPEISLTPQMFSRLKARFGESCAILHSGLSAGERFDEWWRLRSGEAKIAIGARSAIFAPLQNVGIIVIDEEHDSSYTSDVSPRYSTIDIAKFRRNVSGAKLVLGSATPSIESYLNAQNGEYHLVKMNNRVNGKKLPNVIVTDMRKELRSGNPSPFSRELIFRIKDTIDKGNQVMIFLNRRGYSQKIICKDCGYVAKCLHCDVGLKYHKAESLLKCHFCGRMYKVPKVCPECGSVNIEYNVMGTERIVEELEKQFSNAKVLRMDNDTTQNKEAHFKILSEFQECKANILVGTQMIAKGHDFPNVTLVGILNADLSLYYNDYRAQETTFQLITQVAGRCGRAQEEGVVVLQTYSPDNPTLLYAIKYDYDNFYKYESGLRKAANFPPYTEIIRVMVESQYDNLAIEGLKQVFFGIKDIQDEYSNSFIYFNKMASPIKRIDGYYRYQVLARISDNREIIEKRIYSIVESVKDKKTRIYVEINPGSLT